ncbi:hypothetical protein [Noviherbaspirillum sp.]|jgi:hypothetical protein|uniref:hypothetical protein n=1 Tax=Noviherbaspirillum sp. TaxID=1926288 RepID=UPI0025FBDDAC|nr:hypothetical protein [Noviherbaspirillum sp.]
MIIEEQLTDIKLLIQRAAVSHRAVSFSALFSAFPKGTRPENVYDTLEASCAALADWRVAIYSVVLAKNSTGLPGDGFFDIFCVHRESEYQKIAGKTHVHALTTEQRIRMVQLEKIRVYEHAKHA